ncbi:MAG: SocA family protein [Flavobacterium sp.]|nr:SocA family protein [Flavobacterium sp.]
MNTFNYKKSVQALNYLAVLEGGAINYMKALKLIWLSDRYHLRNHGRTITGDEYFALKKGPVASCTLDLIKGLKISIEELTYRNIYLTLSTNYIISSKYEVNNKVFSSNELKVLHTIYNSYCIYNEFELSELSHSFPEWKEYEEKLKIGKRYKINVELFYINFNDCTKLFINSEEEINDIKEYQSTFHPAYC